MEEKVLSNVYENWKDKSMQEKLELVALNNFLFDVDFFKKMFQIENSKSQELIELLANEVAIDILSDFKYQILDKEVFVEKASELIKNIKSKKKNGFDEENGKIQLSKILKKGCFGEKDFLKSFEVCPLEFYCIVDALKDYGIVIFADDMILRVADKFRFYEIVKKELNIKEGDEKKKPQKFTDIFYQLNDDTIFIVLKKYLINNADFLKMYDDIFDEKVSELKTKTQKFDALVKYYNSNLSNRYLFKFFVMKYYVYKLDKTYEVFLINLEKELSGDERNGFYDKLDKINGQFNNKK